MKKFLLSIVLFHLTAAGISEAAVNMEPYFPLGDHDSWTYQVQELSMTISQAVSQGFFNVNGVNTKEMLSSQGIRQYFTNDSIGIRKHKTYLPSNVSSTGMYIIMTFSPPLKYANAQMQIGIPVSSGGAADVFMQGYGQFLLTFQVNSTLVGFENVSVPAGIFPAIRVRTIAETFGPVEGGYFYQKEDIDFWYVENMGIAKQAIIVTDGINNYSQTYVLTQTNLPIPFRGFFDYDGNTIADFAAYHFPSNQFLTKNSGNLGKYGWGQEDSMPLVWDPNGDGRTELSFYHLPTNQWFAKTYPGDNLGQYGWNADECIPVPGDYNGDGISERAFYHWPTNRWFVEGRPPVQFGYDGAASIPIAGDFDGDGITDMVIYHLDSNQWFMHGVGHLGQFGWGGADCLPVPGDWDGDGKMEIGIYHVPTNQWFWRDSAGTAHFPGQYGWGGAASFPIPADYGGGWAAERAFYRPSENSWFVEGQTAFRWGWGGEDFMPVTTQMAIFNWYRFYLSLFQ